MKTLYRIYEFLFDRWVWEPYETDDFDYREDGLIYKKVRVTVYKLTNKFDGSVKYKSQTIEI